MAEHTCIYGDGCVLIKTLCGNSVCDGGSHEFCIIVGELQANVEKENELICIFWQQISFYSFSARRSVINFGYSLTG